jgi:8-oxo-dGTP pyrophosphatase MutT (NUDIX family)
MNPPTWLLQAASTAQKPPEAPRLSFLIDQHEVGSVTPDLADWLTRQVPGLVRDANALTLLARCQDDREASLHQIALALRAGGRAGAWRNELLAVLDDNDQRISRIERAAVRQLGIRTQAVHLMAFAPDGRLWLQQRAWDKATDPGRWDTLVGGLVSASEASLHDALVRESMEEAGLDLTRLDTPIYRGTLRECRPIDTDGYMIEDMLVWELELPDHIAPRNLDGEVADFACLPWAQVQAMLADHQFTLEATLMIAVCAAQRGWIDRSPLLALQR